MSNHLDSTLENSPQKIHTLIGLKSCFYNLDRNTELTRAVDVMQRNFTFDFDD